MSSDRDFTFGRSSTHDENLRRMHEVVVDFDDSMVTSVIAGLIWLDQQAGKDTEKNVIVMAPGYAMWLPPMVTFPDPEQADVMRRLAEAGEAGREADPVVLARADELFTRPFRVTFTCPGGEYTFPFIDGLTRTIRVLTEAEMESDDLPGIFTTTASGERIHVQTGHDCD